MGVFEASRNLTVDQVRTLLDYDPVAGTLTLKAGVPPRRYAGELLDPKNRWVSIGGTRFVFADLAWLHYYGEWPTGRLDHKDRNHVNNAISNLRPATQTQNQWNKATPTIHGYKGVTWRNRQQKPWLARIRIGGGRRINLGSFATKEEAATAYEEAALKYHGEFACLETHLP